jgi:aspartate racemase
MKTIGIVGGIGPESTIDYYRTIIATYRERQPDGSFPSIIINSIDAKNMMGLIASSDLGGAIDMMVAEIERLARAGAAYGLLAANTPHIVFDDVQRRSPIPLVSIVEATCQAVKALGLKRPALIGTRFTMQGRFYPEVFEKEGVTLVVPNAAEQTYIHDKYMNELVQGKFLAETRDGLLAIIEQMKQRTASTASSSAAPSYRWCFATPPRRASHYVTTQIHAKRSSRERGRRVISRQSSGHQPLALSHCLWRLPRPSTTSRSARRLRPARLRSLALRLPAIRRVRRYLVTRVLAYALEFTEASSSRAGYRIGGPTLSVRDRPT